MTEKLFVYGTLQNIEAQKKILGRVLESSGDSLAGYKKTTVNIEGEMYSILKKSRNRFDIVLGKVLEVTEEDLKKLDKYETDAYRRIEVVLSSGKESWVYVK